MPPELSPLARIVLPQIEEFLSGKLGAGASAESMRRAVTEHPALVALDKSLIDECLQALFRRRGVIEPMLGPRLLVDWGEHPRIGVQTRPEFSLICDPSWSEPIIGVLVDRQLDHDPADPALRPRRVEAGLWTFHVPIRLTTQGIACLPGHYLIRIVVEFRRATADRPRFFRTNLRLKIPSESSAGQRVLEIDGDGQSVVNLHGHDLAAFGKIVLKATESGIINLQSAAVGGSADLRSEPAAVPPASFEYQLIPDAGIESEMPQVRRSGPLYRADALTLVLADGKKLHVLAKKRIAFGRSRENDIVLRFLPRSESNDANSRVLSRTHLVVEFGEQGVVLRNTSNRGVGLNGEPIEAQWALSGTDIGLSHSLELAPTQTGHVPFGLAVRLFGSVRNDDARAEQLAWDEICFDLIGERPGPLWPLAAANRIDACRMIRSNNQPRLEEYVLLFRQATIGGNDAAIDLGASVVGSTSRIFHCGQSFWLQTRRGVPLRVDRRDYDEPALVPLVPQQAVLLHGIEFEVASFAQAFGSGTEP